MRFPKEMNAQSEFGLSNLKRGVAVFSHIRLLAGGCWCRGASAVYSRLYVGRYIGAARAVMPRAWRPAEMSQSGLERRGRLLYND